MDNTGYIGDVLYNVKIQHLPVLVDILLVG